MKRHGPTTRRVCLYGIPVAACCSQFLDQHIELFKRITKILNQLTDDVELHLDTRSLELETLFDRASDRAGNLGTQLDKVGDRLESLEHFLETRILDVAEVCPSTCDSQPL